MNVEERDAYYDRLVAAVGRGEMTWGEAVRGLRKDVAGLNQQQFARATKLSVRTLRNLEQDAGNPTMATLEAALRPFGLTLTIQRRPDR